LLSELGSCILHQPIARRLVVVSVLIVAVTAAVVVVVRHEGVLGALLFGALVRTTRRRAVVFGAFISRGPCQEY
jgi:Kef-type K+ transport system membrane component KefB